ncbi:right-handed parallel beta-helix repeat-containing protein [Microbulbifer sp. TRSA002]|uniref:right-handed parallel beta-helix repeat-containing protein n=1 Tax=Microbulbifer sp. TRSA002 TaxID=3243382 RepID=UPI00403906A0
MLKLACLAAVGASAVFLSSGVSAVSCGDVVTVPEILEGAIESCAVSPAVTITDAGSLDLNGYSISCNGSGVGVNLQGAGRILSNSEGGGFIENCATGVSVEGVGAHFIQNVSVMSNSNYGVALTSNNNVVLDLFSSFNSGVGVRVLGDFNQVINAEISANNSSGMEVSGDGNVINSNEYQLNDDNGIVILDADNNLIVGNLLDENGTNGILLEADNQHGNVITGNEVNDSGNTDLRDQNNPACVNNVWISNTFGSSNDSCIQ